MADNNAIWQQVKSAVDIVDVVAEHLVLKRAGKEFKCLCPFHDDHRPSMAVVPLKQIYSCPVCGAVGDVFKFVMNYHKMTNGEALRYLAQKAGITLPELKGRSQGQREGEKSARELIVETNERACVFFEKTLRSEGGGAGLAYFMKRGLTDAIIQQFRLGFSPDGWTGLLTAASRAGLPADRLDGAGLVKKRNDGSFYDAFRNRVMFPIMDAMGRIIAFGGRVLVEKRDEAGNIVEAKYLNSPETPVFVKSQTLYGLHLAKRAIMESDTAVLVEGYTDVIACHQAGVTNVVATLGTALTPAHARVLRNLCKTVILVFDSDAAGEMAAGRAMETFVREPLDVKIASVPEGKDPCDFCMANGGEAFRKVLGAAKDAIACHWDALRRKFRDTDGISARQAAMEQLMGFVARSTANNDLDSAKTARKWAIAERMASLFGVPVQEINQRLRQLGQAAAPRGSVAALPPPQPEPDFQDDQSLTGTALAEGWVLGALLTEPTLYHKIREDMNLGLFQTFRPLATRVMEYLENAPELASCSLGEFISALDTDLGGNPEIADGERKLSHKAVRLEEMVRQGGKAEQNLADGWKLLWELEMEAATSAGANVQVDVAQLQRSMELQLARRARGEVRRILGPTSLRST